MKVISEGDVRIAEVKITMGHKYRHITRLCFLDNQDISNGDENNVVDDKMAMNSEDNRDDLTVLASGYIRPSRTTRVPRTSKLKDIVCY